MAKRAVKLPKKTAVYDAKAGKWKGPGCAWLIVKFRRAVAQLFSMSESGVVEWETLHGLPMTINGEYDLAELVKWRIERAKQGAGIESAGKVPALSHQKLEQEVRMRRLRADILESALLQREEVKVAHDELVTLVSSRLDEIAAQAASACPPEVAGRVFEIVDNAVRQARKDLAEAAIT